MSTPHPAPTAPPVPTRARALAARLAALFETDSKIVSALNDAITCSPAPTTDCAPLPRRTRWRSTTRSIVRSAPTSQPPRSAASSPSRSASSPSNWPTRSPPPAIAAGRRAQRTSTSSRPAPGRRPNTQTRTNHERASQDPGARSAGGGARPRAAPPRDPDPLPRPGGRSPARAADPTRIPRRIAQGKSPRAHRATRETTTARRPVPTDQTIGGLPFEDNPKLPQATIAALAEGSWIDDRESVILIGESGTGKRCSPQPSACAPANKADASASPPSPASRPSSKKPTAANSSPASSAATPAPRPCSSMNWDTQPRGRRGRARLPSHLRTQRARIADRDHEPAVR